jgi:histidinol phosphatase-like PHP family hydrolase
MTWQPVDCHAHSTMSDGHLAVPLVIERAREVGVRPSISDHVSRDVSYAVKSVLAFRDYLDALEQYDVLRGAEFCCHDSLWREIPDDLTARLTHRLGSLHAVPLPGGSRVGAFTRTIPDDVTPARYMEAFVTAMESLAATMPIDILSHPTLVTLPFRRIAPEELWSEDHECRVVEALARAGIAFEVSNRYRPHERLVRRAVDAGVRLSLGSDGHTREQVGDIAWGLKLARTLGVHDADLYDPTVHGSRALGMTTG